MKQVISFSLYGNAELYLKGALENAQDAQRFYPGWIPRFYTGSSVSEAHQQKLRELGAEVFPIAEPESPHAKMWRFLVFADSEVDRAIIRDSDSRLSTREATAVKEWLESGKDFHIMRDHPYHNLPMMGGMWGAKASSLRDIESRIKNIAGSTLPDVDQVFLIKHVYPLARRSVCVHDAFFVKELHRKHFPTPRVGQEFIGKIIDHDGKPNRDHRATLALYEKTLPKIFLILKDIVRSCVKNHF